MRTLLAVEDSAQQFVNKLLGIGWAGWPPACYVKRTACTVYGDAAESAARLGIAPRELVDQIRAAGYAAWLIDAEREEARIKFRRLPAHLKAHPVQVYPSGP